jgi:hypothetical protein
LSLSSRKVSPHAEPSPPTRPESTVIKVVEGNDGCTQDERPNPETPPNTDGYDEDDGSVGTCYTLKEEANIIKDYEEK